MNSSQAQRVRVSSVTIAMKLRKDQLLKKLDDDWPLLSGKKFSEIAALEVENLILSRKTCIM